MMRQLPSLQINGRVACVTLQRPEAANKLTTEDLTELCRHFQTVDQTPEVLVLVLRAQGKHFCSGFDISTIAKDSQTEGSRFGKMVDELEKCTAITIAAVHGGVYGGATDMALACDFRIGSQDTEMFMPAARLGLHFYLSGMERYVSRLGVDVAKRLFLTGEKMDAQSMYASGFLTHLVDRAAFDEQLQRLSGTLSAMAPLPLLGMKKHLNHIARGIVDPVAVAADVKRSLQSEDLAEGGRAWQEKRRPIFVGR
ncbi:enoyl-CoA hydratase/isomerase family protein [Verminephrobacter eiseniae]|uniref:enoyl-CoA hydratase/isomerase family protein n=1 Tax=Verminephrobacter eiseniae TaxID=364317 RepID=UPI0010DC1406|nr:enoyl-CoA hydratase/isomerase family protein [Verminephrobacter eiseniae]KAB7623740.1 enoyl-CoA hydratase/isomerase family protein [Verminephrobacter sp. Larva24]MCW5234079.1 enoyl-CoA hydratase/isomerase family protein [Verminephrobacter eiseniae]MCW5294365.1 enoyl-CoA hydratase/isomerase family protein [Verminephrobacter eiseniae]MCW8186419.1 enoyl-CoA hydratase/isomerase family protein [Verminephrobacter eiseniae]MCW8224866.1 enoyl-CoA hydratase/isomerase family protein [Verminephrobacte